MTPDQIETVARNIANSAGLETAHEIDTLTEAIHVVIETAIIETRQYAEAAEAECEKLRAQLHGMQDGAALRDSEAKCERLREALETLAKDKDNLIVTGETRGDQFHAGRQSMAQEAQARLDAALKAPEEG